MVHLGLNPHQFKLDPVLGQQWRLHYQVDTWEQLDPVAHCLLGDMVAQVDWEWATSQIDPHQFKLDPVPGQQCRPAAATQPQLGLVAHCLLGGMVNLVN
jgi:hypothetical protein